MPDEHPAPLFSVVIPTLDRADVITRALESVRAQTEQNFEIIVVDDGSSDDTAQVVAALDDERILYVRQEHLGVTAARNTGVRTSRAPWVTFVDSDDEVESTWLETFREAFEKESADIVCVGLKTLYDGKEEGSGRLPKDLGPPYYHQRGLFLTGTFALKREIFEAVGGYTESLRCAENTDLALKLTGQERGWRIVCRDVKLLLYHKQPYRWSRSETLFRYQMDASHHVLEQHGERYRKPHPRGYANYCALIGVNAARLGETWKARRWLLRASLAYPRKVRNHLRFLISLLPGAGRPFWLRKQSLGEL